jgi:hypothetical protein
VALATTASDEIRACAKHLHGRAEDRRHVHVEGDARRLERAGARRPGWG